MHVPPSGLLVEDAERLLVHPSTPQGSSRVWRSWPDREEVEALVLAKANTASSAPILRRAGFHLIARERRYTLEIPTPAHPRA